MNISFWWFRTDLVYLPEWTFDRKLISANSNPKLNSNLNPHPNPNSNPNPNTNPKAQNRFRKTEMTSFFEQVSRYPRTNSKFSGKKSKKQQENSEMDNS